MLQESVAQYKNVLIVDCRWQLASAVRHVEPDTSNDYERLESRLRVQRAALRQCLANKPSTRYQLDLLRLVAFLSTLLVSMKRRNKVPDITRTLHNMAGIACFQPFASVTYYRQHISDALLLDPCKNQQENGKFDPL